MLGLVAEGVPGRAAERVVLQDHGVDTKSSLGREASLGCRDEGSGHALPSPVPTNCDAVEVAAPAVPPSDHGTDDVLAHHGEEQRVRVTVQESFHRWTIVLPIRALDGFSPERENRLHIAQSCRTHLVLSDHAFTLLADVP